jgi:cysteine synthase A
MNSYIRPLNVDSELMNSPALRYPPVQSWGQQPTLHDNILSTVGNTPIVKINKLAPQGVNVYAKLESFNPLGSVKDRLALGIIEAAERDGSLLPGQTVIEATSGNTGIGLAMVCAQKGYPLVVTMAENFSIERRRLMRFLGAKVVLTPAARMGSGMLAKAQELAQEHGWFLCRQFTNDANADIHSQTTAQEILRDFRDIPLDYFVTGFGTGGTLKGIARVLKKESPHTRIVAVEPENSPVLQSGIAQSFDHAGDPQESHPSFRPHVVQGWAPDFMSKITHDAVQDELIDELRPIEGRDALSLARRLATDEGIFCGISSGATLAGALAIAEQSGDGANILCMLPDTGERYLSTPLFEDIPVEMTIEEKALSQTTPGFRFDAPKTDERKVIKESPPEATTAARDFLNHTINQQSHPIVMFSLEWCEFCWSVKKLLDRLNVDCQTIDLDSAKFQSDNWGGEIRMALREQTLKSTIPQIYLAGQHLGGCTDVFDQFKSGQLQQKLAAQAIPYNDVHDLDPYTLLPSWLHPR